MGILTILSAFNISMNITNPEIYDSQSLNEKLKSI